MKICSQGEYKLDRLRNTPDKLEKNLMQENKHLHFPQYTHASTFHLKNTNHNYLFASIYTGLFYF